MKHLFKSILFAILIIIAWEIVYLVITSALYAVLELSISIPRVAFLAIELLLFGASFMYFFNKDGIKGEEYTENWPNGHIKVRGQLLNGEKHGTWEHFDEAGQFIKEEKFD